MATRVSKNRTGVNKDVKTKSVRGLDGKFTKAYKGNFKNSAKMKEAKLTASKFGTRQQKYRDIRASFGFSSG